MRREQPEPLSRAELEQASAVDVADARTLIVGIWDGHAFSLDGELGHTTSAPVAEGAQTACFDAAGGFALVTDRERPPRPGCLPRSRTYSLRHEADALVVEATLRGGCEGDAGHAKPYTYVSYLHRLDDRFLVLIDGSTGAVTGYRRR